MPVRHRIVASLAAATLAVTGIVVASAPAQSDPVIGPDIKVNNVAYVPGLPKVATVVSGETTPVPWVLENASGAEVASGQTAVFGADQPSGDHVHLIDFSTFDEPGSGYRLTTAGAVSYPFDISSAPYDQLRYDALQFYYHQRSGIDIEAQFVGGDHARPAGHVNVSPNTGDENVPCRPATPCGYTLDVRGGWYDAGDHGKYVVNGGISTWQLLNAYERAVYHGEPGAIGDGTLSIPENSNGVADILDEARWNVEFLLSMQVPGDQPLAGMAHHKIHDENWTGLPLPPHQDPQSRYLAPPSTAATLNLAAVAAQCARIWTEIDPGFAALCLNTAESAYAAAQANPDIIANPDDGTGGGPYSDPNVADEFYWAAAELFVSTGSQAYLADLTSHELYFGESFNDRGADWGSTGLLGDITLAVAPNELPAGDVTALRTSFTTAADNLLTIMDDQGYPAPYREVRNGALWYDWGSNNLLLNNAVVLALAHDFTDADPYRDGVFATLDYMLGRNPLSQSYITGYGEQATSNPHHRFWAHQIDASYPSAPPGVLAGGPNSGLQDPLVAAELAGCSPQKCYLDHIDSWSTNEVTINWNSVLSWVAVWAGENLPDGPPPEDSEPPSQPGTPMVSDVTSSSSTLTWSASTDNVGVVGYDVHLDGDVTGTSVPSITLSDLSPDTTYSVYVIARDAADNPSPPSDSVEFTTEPDDPPGGAECTVTYTSQPWNEGPTHGGFTAHIAMTNAGDQAIDGWTLSFDLPAGQGFTQGWSASWSVSGQTVSATPLSWNEIIAPGQAVEVGFNGTWTGSYANPDTFSCS